ncbi:hypothetical protein E2C01_049272 [Portunus trituberculatus]|uniref:Uncharacterized protein n=1 Tax=Portunus trituberculatus TaxID=210409 RepID=A0A5B7GCL4_PORTR|nr:hypothetical protein [Portunus trituberculatus]
MSAWLQLCRLPDREAVQHIRLTFVPALQSALDSRYTETDWNILSTEEALEELSKLILRSSNQAALWANKFVSDYFRRCTEMATDFYFKCPRCTCNFSE